jgi:hypothetical protein
MTQVADLAELSMVPVDALPTDAIAYVDLERRYYLLRRNIAATPDGWRYIQALSTRIASGGRPVALWERGNAAVQPAEPRRGALNARDFGALGGLGTDATAAINLALEAARDHRCGLYIPAGNYRVTGPLTVYPNTCVFGAGADLTTIYYTGITLTGSPGSHAFNGTAYRLFTTVPSKLGDPVKRQNVTIRDLRIVGDNGPSDVNPDAPAFRVVDLYIQAESFAVYVPEAAYNGHGHSSDVTVTRCRLEQLFGFTFRNDGTQGVRMHFTHNKCKDVTGDTNVNAGDSFVTYNTFDRCWGVECGGPNVQITHNEYRNGIGPAAISVGGSTGDTFYTGDTGARRGIFGGSVTDNIIDAPGGTGVLLNSGCVGTVVARNQISRVPAAFHGIAFNTEFGEGTIPQCCVVEHNVLQSIGHIAIWLGQGGHRNTVRSNKVLRNQVTGALDTQYGIVIQHEVDCTLEGNEVDAAIRDYEFGFNTRLRFPDSNTGSKIYLDVDGQGAPTNTFRRDERVFAIFGAGAWQIPPYTRTVRLTANGAVSALLPGPAEVGDGHCITINHAGGQLGTTTFGIRAGQAGTIAGSATFPLTGAWSSVTFQSDLTNWLIAFVRVSS